MALNVIGDDIYSEVGLAVKFIFILRVKTMSCEGQRVIVNLDILARLNLS